MRDKHTPGPWTAEVYLEGAFEIVTEKSFGGCLVLCSRSQHTSRASEMHANAALIASAPELLTLARQYASECAECDGEGGFDAELGFEEVCEACADIRKIIAKAVGK